MSRKRSVMSISWACIRFKPRGPKRIPTAIHHTHPLLDADTEALSGQFYYFFVSETRCLVSLLSSAHFSLLQLAQCATIFYPYHLPFPVPVFSEPPFPPSECWQWRSNLFWTQPGLATQMSPTLLEFAVTKVLRGLSKHCMLSMLRRYLVCVCYI